MFFFVLGLTLSDLELYGCVGQCAFTLEACICSALAMFLYLVKTFSMYVELRIGQAPYDFKWYVRRAWLCCPGLVWVFKYVRTYPNVFHVCI